MYCIVLASRVTGCHLDTQSLKTHPVGHPKYFERNFLKYQLQAYYRFFFHLNIISMALYMHIVTYFIEWIHVYGCNQSILGSPLKNRAPQNCTIANFGHPVSESWLRH